MRTHLQFLLVVLFGTFSVLGQTDLEAITRGAHKTGNEGKFAEAAAEMSKAIAIEPTNASLYLQRARFYNFAKDETNFYKDVDRALQLDPDGESVVITASRLLLDTGDVKACEKVLATTAAYISKHSQSDAAYDARFRAKTCIGDMVGAFNDISTASEINPQSASHRSNRANILSRLGESEQALELFQMLINSLESKIAALQKDQDKTLLTIELAMTYLSRSKVHDRNGDEHLVISDLTRSVELLPNEFFLRSRALAYKKYRRYLQAISDLNRAIEAQKSDDFMLYADRGDTFLLAGKYKEAILDFEECIKRNPTFKARFEAKIADAKRKQSETP